VIAIVDKLVKDRVYVVGHDWGATIAWSHPVSGSRDSPCHSQCAAPHGLQHNIGTNPAPVAEELVRAVLSAPVAAGVSDLGKWLLVAEEAQESLQFCADGKLTYFPDATHWLQHEEPKRVNELLIEFLLQAWLVTFSQASTVRPGIYRTPAIPAATTRA
jgi:pimeloyl-ACP methyl ester carboxylesterase